MKKQETFTDIEYSFRKKKTKREEFLEIMDEIIPWDEWVGVIEPYYPKGKRGRPPMGIEKMLRMYLLQIWFNLSDSATEDAIYDSYADPIIEVISNYLNLFLYAQFLFVWHSNAPSTIDSVLFHCLS